MHPRLALGISYRGGAYSGWQSQLDQPTVQGVLETALAQLTCEPIRVVCAGRTDAGVHGLNQVVHLDAPVQRPLSAWVRGTNAYLPTDVSVQWCHPVSSQFHARNSAHGRRYTYILLQSPTRPALESGLVGWVFQPLAIQAMREGAQALLGEHDFSAFRSSQCQARSPIKTLRRLDIERIGAYWRFDFDGSAFLHHMVRNIMGCLLFIGMGRQPASWMQHVLACGSRDQAAPTFCASGLYFAGPYYDPVWNLPTHTLAMDWLPQRQVSCSF
jgi:tRNA pseudouridine38-40 synthase